jgi:hypothetical protein
MQRRIRTTLVVSPRALRFALLLLLGLAACKEDTIVPATQVVVSVNSDLAIGEQLARVDVEVRDESGEQVVEQRSFELSEQPRAGEVGLPFSFAVVKGKAERFRLDVIGYGPLGPGGALRPVIERKTLARFRTHESLLLKVFLGGVCFDNVCSGERTCYPEASDTTSAGDCGSTPEGSLRIVKPGDESGVWTQSPGARDAGMRDRDAATPRDGGEPEPAGNGGKGGSAPEPDAGDRDSGEPIGGDGGNSESGSGGSGESGGSGGSSASGSGGSDEPACVPVGERMFNHDSVPPSPHLTAPEPPGFYNSSPPSSGQHCEAWGMWTEYSEERPLPACNFVHNLEHGSIALLYNCPDGCDDIVALLRQVIADAGPDPDCSGDGIRRLLLTPYHDMSVRLAASAWGYTWTSDCVDDTTHDTLIDFIHRHWGTNPNGGAGEAPEATYCAEGSTGP